MTTASWIGIACTFGVMAISPSALGEEPAKMSANGLVGANGMSLYIFDRDAAGSGKSNCNGACAGNWPPLTAEAGAADHGDWTVLTRDDGTRQWAYKGKPLYFWSKDTQPGERTGDGFNGLWHAVKP